MTSLFARRPVPQEEATIVAPGALGTALMTSWRGNCGVGFLPRPELRVANDDQNEGSVSVFVMGLPPTAIWDVSRTAREIAVGVKATSPLGLGHWARAADVLAGIGLG